jgi:MFS family permease
VLGVREFRALWLAEFISVCGDQLARVALSVLVYQRTTSVALTAATYALTFLPALVGGALLAGLADRYPRRTVLIITDVGRAVLAGLMALPGLPIPVLWVFVFGLAFAGAPFKAAQLALLPDVLEGERYPIGLSLRTVSNQLAQLAGFAGGGAVLLVISPQAALGLNAGTFLFSAVVVWRVVRRRPAARGAVSQRSTSAVGLIRRDRNVFALVGLIALAGVTVAPEGVAAPYASGLGGSAVAVGVLMAADPLGSAVGAWLNSHWRSAARNSAVVPLAILSGVALMPCVLRPGLAVSALLWAVSGALTTMMLIQTQTILTSSVPDDRRAAVIGLASGGLQASQGLAVLGAGLLGGSVGVFRAVGLVGALTAVVAALLGALMRRARPQGRNGSRDEHGAGHGMSDARVTGHGYASRGTSSSRSSHAERGEMQ